MVFSNATAMLLAPGGAPLESDTFSVAPFTEAAAWNGNDWLFASFIAVDASPYGRLHHAVVDLGDPSPPSPRVTATRATQQRVPDVEIAGDTAFVVWHEATERTFYLPEIRVTRVVNGVPLDGRGIVIAEQTFWERSWAAATDGERLLVVWQDSAGTFGRYVSRDGNRSPPFLIRSAQGAVNVVWGGSEFVVLIGTTYVRLRPSGEQIDGSLPLNADDFHHIVAVREGYAVVSSESDPRKALRPHVRLTLFSPSMSMIGGPFNLSDHPAAYVRVRVASDGDDRLVVGWCEGGFDQESCSTRVFTSSGIAVSDVLPLYGATVWTGQSFLLAFSPLSPPFGGPARGVSGIARLTRNGLVLDRVETAIGSQPAIGSFGNGHSLVVSSRTFVDRSLGDADRLMMREIVEDAPPARRRAAARQP